MYAPNLGYREQILHALNTKPDLAGIIHGQRGVLKGSPYRRVCSFPSEKAGGTLLLESGIEAAIGICAESSPGIVKWVTQGLRVALSWKEYVIIDFVARRTDGSLIAFEGKASIKGLSSEKRDRYAYAKDLLRREGIEFQIIDASMLPSKGQLDTLRTFYVRGHQQNWSADIIKLTTELLKSASHRSIIDGRRLLISEKIPANLCDYLVFHRIISFKDAVNDALEIAA